MRKGKIEKVPSGIREGLNGRMEQVEKLGNLMTGLNGHPCVQAPKRPLWSNPVKPSQTWSSLVKAKRGVWPSIRSGVTEICGSPEFTSAGAL